MSSVATQDISTLPLSCDGACRVWRVKKSQAIQSVFTELFHQLEDEHHENKTDFLVKFDEIFVHMFSSTFGCRKNE